MNGLTDLILEDTCNVPDPDQHGPKMEQIVNTPILATAASPQDDDSLPSPAEYLEAIYGREAPGFFSIWHKPTKRTDWTPASDPYVAAARMQSLAERGDVYFSWALQGEALGPQSRGKAEGAILLPGILFDFDIRNPDAHAKANLPDSEAEVHAFIEEAGLPTPTAWISSGNGLYGIWLFEEPWQIDSKAERRRAADLVKRFQDHVIAEGQRRHGWSFDFIGDLARVTRLPGTRNWKTNPPKPVRLLTWKPSVRYRPEQVESILPQAARPSAARPPSKSPPPAKRGKGESLPELGPILEGCSWMAHCRDAADRLPEPDWYAGLGIIGRCAGGRHWAHELSNPYPGYDPGETDRKLDQALNRAGPATCGHVQEKLGWPGCATCPFNGRLTSPIQLGHEPEALIRLARDYVHVADVSLWVDLATFNALSEKGFNALHLHELQKGPNGLLLRSPLTRKVHSRTFRPGQGLILSEQGRDLLNLWRPSDISPTPGDVTLFLDHMAYLLPDPEVAAHVLDYLAHLAQRPGDKVKHMMLLTGRQGTGKSFIGETMALLLGSHNVGVLNNDDMVSRWTSAFAFRQLVVVEELMAANRLETYNRMKIWITQDLAIAEEKHLPRFETPTPRGIIAFSNHQVPIYIADDDRRIFYYDSPAEPRDAAYYRQLHEWRDANLPVILDYLLKRPLDGFNPAAHPPMTAAKAEVIQQSRTPLAQDIEAMMMDERWPFVGDLVRLEQVRGALDYRLKTPPLAKVGEALQELGAVKLAQIRVPGRPKEKVRLWAWRNQEKWRNASAREQGEHWKNSCLADVPAAWLKAS